MTFPETPVVLDQWPEAAELAQKLRLPICAEVAEGQWCLRQDNGRLALHKGGAKAAAIAIDFDEQLERRRQGKELLFKALGKSRQRLSVLDATAGLGRDSFLISQRNYQVQAIERHPVVAAMLADALQRYRDKYGDTPFELIEADSRALIESAGEGWDIIYLDPMFPASGKSALAKKEMQAFHALVGEDRGGEALLGAALEKARYRVVVKRALKAPLLGDLGPSVQIKGKTVRFDVYALKKLP